MVIGCRRTADRPAGERGRTCMMLPPRLCLALRSLALSTAAAVLVLVAGGPLTAQDGNGQAQVESGLQSGPSLDVAAVSERQPLLLQRAFAGLQATRTDPSPPA